METKFDNLVDEFYDTFVKGKYDLSREHFRQIAKSPFEMVRYHIESSDSIQNIRLKYLGMFYMKPSMMKHLIRSTEKMFASGKLTEEQYKNRINKLKKKANESKKNNLEEY